MAKRTKQIHRGAFHLVHAKMNHQWWITMGRGGPSSWSILSKHSTYDEAYREWKRIHAKEDPKEDPRKLGKREALAVAKDRIKRRNRDSGLGM